MGVQHEPQELHYELKFDHIPGYIYKSFRKYFWNDL